MIVPGDVENAGSYRFHGGILATLGTVSKRRASWSSLPKYFTVSKFRSCRWPSCWRQIRIVHGTAELCSPFGDEGRPRDVGDKVKARQQKRQP